jgi:hypothetical protein
MEMTLRTNNATTHRFTVPCFTIMHLGLLDTIWRRSPIIKLPFLCTRGNNGLYNDAATIVDEFSIVMEMWVSS